MERPIEDKDAFMNLKRQIKTYGMAALAFAAIPGVASAASLGNLGKNWGPNQSL